jgi:methionyl aminopeptidase
MKVTLKTKEEIALLKKSGKILVTAMNLAIARAKEAVTERVTTMELDEIVEKYIRDNDATPAFLHYSDGYSEPFPGSICISINDEIVHGIPKKDEIIKEGDLVSLDLGVEYKGMYTDAATTLMIGNVSEEAKKITEVTKKSLSVGIAQLKDGARLGDYGFAVDQFATKNGFVTIKGLVGHGVGHAVHEPPQIPNYGEKNTGFKIKAGMVLALEPMLAISDDRISLGEDEFAFVTYDGGLSAHFEHTVVITKKGCEIVTDGIKT